jgi:hypothetical protein
MTTQGPSGNAPSNFQPPPSNNNKPPAWKGDNKPNFSLNSDSSRKAKKSKAKEEEEAQSHSNPIPEKKESSVFSLVKKQDYQRPVTTHPKEASKEPKKEEGSQQKGMFSLLTGQKTTPKQHENPHQPVEHTGPKKEEVKDDLALHKQQPTEHKGLAKEEVKDALAAHEHQPTERTGPKKEEVKDFLASRGEQPKHTGPEKEEVKDALASHKNLPEEVSATGYVPPKKEAIKNMLAYNESADNRGRQLVEGLGKSDDPSKANALNQRKDLDEQEKNRDKNDNAPMVDLTNPLDLAIPQSPQTPHAEASLPPTISTHQDFTNLVAALYTKVSHIDGHETTVQLKDGSSVHVKNQNGTLSITVSTSDYRVQKVISDNVGFIKENLGNKDIKISEINIQTASAPRSDNPKIRAIGEDEHPGSGPR